MSTAVFSVDVCTRSESFGTESTCQQCQPVHNVSGDSWTEFGCNDLEGNEVIIGRPSGPKSSVLELCEVEIIALSR